MFEVCLDEPTRDFERNQWSFVLSHFPPERAYTLVPPGGESGFPAGTAKAIDARALDALSDVVVITPANAMNVPGDQPLTSFSHPKDCVYFFGADHWHLEREPPGTVAKVCIPTGSKDQMYSWVAYAVVMWDRRIKGG